MMHCTLWRRRRDCRFAPLRRARACSPRRILWRSACSGHSARRPRTPASRRLTSCWRLAPNSGPVIRRGRNKDLLDPTRQTFIQIDVEPKNASWNFPAEHVLIGDAATVLRQLLREVETKASGRRAQGVARVAAWRAEKGYFNDPKYLSDEAPLLPQRVIGEIAKALAPEGIVTCDAGENAS